MVNLASRQLNLVNVLSAIMVNITQDLNQPVFANNVGVFDSYNHVVVPFSNVGTVLNFTYGIDGYEYVDIYLEGFAAKVDVFTPNLTLSVNTGTSGTDKGAYVVRIPYCGKISAIEFSNFGVFTIKKIIVASGKAKYTEYQDLSQFSVLPSAGLSANGTKLTATVSPAGSVSLYPNMNLGTGFYGKFRVRIYAATPQPTQTFTFTDGQWTYTCLNLEAINFFFTENSLLAVVSYTNITAVNQFVEITPLVDTYSAISTAIGADDDPVSATVANYYVDNTVGIGSDANNGTSVFTPFATLAKAKSVVANGQVIALRSGCTWREAYSDRTGKTGVKLCAYGTGRKPIISALDIIPTGEIAYTLGNLFITIAHTFPSDYEGFFGLWENGRRLLRTVGATGQAGTYSVTSTVGFLVTMKVYPFAQDGGNDAPSWTANAATRIYEITQRNNCVAVNDSCIVDNLHLIGNKSKSGVLCAGVNTVLTNNWIESFLCAGVVQHSGTFTGNNIIRPSVSTLESSLSNHVYYASSKSVAIYDFTVPSNIYDFNSLIISYNEFSSGLNAAAMNAPGTVWAIKLNGAHSNTQINGNTFVNVNSAASFQDSSSGNGLKFTNNFIYNYLDAILVNGPYLDFMGNYVFLDTEDRSFSVSKFLQVSSSGGIINIYNNKGMFSNDMSCAFELLGGAASTVFFTYNTFWFRNPGNTASAPLIRVASTHTMTFNHNLILNCHKVVETTSGALVPLIGVSAYWDLNAYGQVSTVFAMFKWGTPTYISEATFRGATGFDFNSLVGQYRTPRAIYGDLLPDVVPAGIGALSYDLSQYTAPKSFTQYYAN